MSPGYDAATRPLVCSNNCKVLQHEFFGNFVRATCCRVQLVELCGTCCRDKMLQECDVKLCERFCNTLLQKLSNNDG